MKRTTSLILALLMCVSMMPNVFAFTPETVESAAETVPGSESAALAVSNDPAVLGDNYLVDGLGKAEDEPDLRQRRRNRHGDAPGIE